MDMEQSSDFKSIFAKFEDPGCSKTLPGNSPRPLSISNVRSNPAFYGVISALENNSLPPPIARKPDVPAKPSPAAVQRHSTGNKAQQNMRLSKGFRQTLYITDPPQSSGEGVCSRSPQLYRPSRSTSLDANMHPSLGTNQSNNQECYEVIDDSFKTPTSWKPPIPFKPSQKPFQVFETNQSDTQDCYEVVDDSMKAPANHPRPFVAHLSQSLPFSKQRSSPVEETHQLDAQDCYEVVNDTLRTPVTQYTDVSSFSGPEMSQYDGQECYEEVDSNFHTQTERLPPIGGNPQLDVFFPYPAPPHFPEMNEFDTQDNYEAIDSCLDMIVEPPPPFNDAPKFKINLPSMNTVLKPSTSVEPKPKISSSDHSPNKENKPLKPPDVKSKPKLNIPVNKTPRKNPLPSIESLGIPPPKEPRPPQVDLTFYRPAAPPWKKTPTAVSETEYELSTPRPSSTSQEEECYDDASNIYALPHNELNVHEVQGPQAETPKVKTSQPCFPSPSPEEGRECYDDVMKFQEPPADINVYEVEDSGSAVYAPEPPRETVYEVAEEKDFGGSRNQSGTYPGFRLSVSEDHYSTGTLEADRGTLPWSDSKEGRMSKSEQMFRKKFKITGLEDAMYTTTIVLDFKPEKYMLPLKKGDMVDVLRITDCPPGKWLVKDSQGNYGFVPVRCVDISKDILTFSNQHLLATPISPLLDLYADVERPYDSGVGTDLSIASDNSGKSDDTYDDIDSRSSTLSNSGGKKRGLGNFFKKDKGKELGSPSVTMNTNAAMEAGGEYATINVSEGNAREKETKSSTLRSLLGKVKDQKGNAEGPQNEGRGNTQTSAKKIAKEEKIFREKFKYTGDINISSIATINSSAPLSSKDKMGLQVKPGETVEVIDVTNEDQIICRNSEGKFGYVRIEHLNFQSNY